MHNKCASARGISIYNEDVTRLGGCAFPLFFYLKRIEILYHLVPTT